MEVRNVGFIRLLNLLLLVRIFSLSESAYCEYDDMASVAKKLTCTGITSEDDLDDELKLSRRFTVPELIIEHSSFRYFMHDSFLDTNFETIHVRNSSIMGLSDTDVAFEGLENQLYLITIEDCSHVSHWNWHHLRNLSALRSIKIWDSDLDYVSEDLGKISVETVMHIEMVGGVLSALHDNAFVRFAKVKQFHLDYNQISAVSRTMFPNPAENILVINLSSNKLQSLPYNMFENMPVLATISLSNNQIRTMDEKVFGKVWSHLTIFRLNGGPLNCDCRLTWITKSKTGPINVEATCQTPTRLKGHSILDLKQQDLWC